MGNVILMVVRHRDLDAVEKLDLHDIQGGFIHSTDTLPKLFDGGEPWKDRYFDHYGRPANVMLSHYYHYAGSPLLYLDDQMMVDAGHLTHADYTQAHTFEIERFVPGMRKALRQSKHSVLDRKGKLSRPTRSGEKVSLFMLWTDCIDRAEKNEHTMTDVAHYCRTGEARSRTFGSLNHGISAIATLNEDEAAFVRLFDTQVNVQRLPRFELAVTPEECAQVAALYAAEDYGKAFRLYDLAFAREIAAAHGYLVREVASKQIA